MLPIARAAGAFGVYRAAGAGGENLPKILVADDNSNIQKMVSLAFEDHGIDVVAVGNGEAAVRRLPDLKPDLVLADIFMPVRNGYEVCEFVKKDPRFAQVPVILLVGAFDPLDENEARRVGADGVLKKPFVPPDPLIAMVTSALGKAAKPVPALAPEPVAVQVAVTKPPAVSLAPVVDTEPEPAEETYAYGTGQRDLDEEGRVATSTAGEATDETDDAAEIAANRNWRHDAKDFDVPENASAAFVSAIADAEKEQASTIEHGLAEPSTIDLTHEELPIYEAAAAGESARVEPPDAESPAVAETQPHSDESATGFFADEASSDGSHERVAITPESAPDLQTAIHVMSEETPAETAHAPLEIEIDEAPAELQETLAEDHGTSAVVPDSEIVPENDNAVEMPVYKAEEDAVAEEDASSTALENHNEPETATFVEFTLGEIPESVPAMAASEVATEPASVQPALVSEAKIEPAVPEKPVHREAPFHSSGWMEMMAPLPTAEHPVSWSSQLEELLSDSRVDNSRREQPVVQSAVPQIATPVQSPAEPATVTAKSEPFFVDAIEDPKIAAVEEVATSTAFLAPLEEPGEPAAAEVPALHETAVTGESTVLSEATLTPHSEHNTVSEEPVESQATALQVAPNAEVAPPLETTANGFDAAALDAVVSRVVEKLEPRLHEILSNGVLRPLVESVLKKELEKK